MDPFEKRLTSTADRLGWGPDVIEEVRKRREDLVAAPDAISAAIAKAFELPEAERFELRVIGMRESAARGNADGTRFDLHQGAPPTAPATDGPPADPDTVPADAPTLKPPPTPPSIRPSKSSYPPTPVAPAREAERTVSGRTLSDAIRLAHAEPATADLRGLIVKLANVAALVGQAHRQGIVVRNLAPDNLLFGEGGEVVYADPRRIPTPAYCSPELARDQTAALAPTSDVFALGCLLFEALVGAPLFAKVGKEATLKAIVDDERRDFESPFEVPEALSQAYLRATHGAPGSRHVDGSAFAAALDRWLRGEVSEGPDLAEFADHPARVEELRTKAAIKRAEATVQLGRLAPGASLEDKQPAWTREDEAAELDRQADTLERAYVRALEHALAVEPSDAQVRKQLSELLQRKHRAAEEVGDDARAIELAERLKETDGERWSSYLDGKGKLSLVTDPPGATVDLYRYELEDRRLWPRFVRSLGQTPLKDVSLEMGSYVCILKHEDCADVRYPVLIRRRTHWHGRRPDGGAPGPVVLPEKTEVDENDVYVPSGWFVCGGPRDAAAMPLTWTWCGGFIIRRHPVWMGEYLEFLDHGALMGDRSVERYLPRSPDGRPLVESQKRKHRLVGGFGLSPDKPATGVSWAGAAAYAAWHAERTELPWRLPSDLEWEKAARGVDGRIYPWGDGLDPLFACYAESVAGPPAPVDAQAFPADSSPYGVRGMAGNVRDWCRDTWQSRHQIAAGASDPVVKPDGPKVVRGGHYGMTGPGLVTYMRSRIDAATHAPWLGFRLARRFPVDDS